MKRTLSYLVIALLSVSVLFGCGGSDDDTTSNNNSSTQTPVTPPSTEPDNPPDNPPDDTPDTPPATEPDVNDPLYHNPADIPPTISLIESETSANIQQIAVTGSFHSPSEKAVTIVANVNGKLISNISIGDNNMFSIPVTLQEGDNVISVFANEKNGLSASVQKTITYAKNSTMTSDFYIDDALIAENDTKKFTASVSLLNPNDVKTVQIINTANKNVVSTMKDDGKLPDEIKADGIFSSEFSITAKPQDNTCYRVQVSLTNGTQFQSGIQCIEKYKRRPEADYDRLSLAYQIIEKVYETNREKLDRLEAAKQTVSYLNNYPAFSELFSWAKYDKVGNINFETINGLYGVFEEEIEGTLSKGLPKNAKLILNYDYRVTIGSQSVTYIEPFESDHHGFRDFPIKDDKSFNVKKFLNTKDLNVFEISSPTGIFHITTHGGFIPEFAAPFLSTRIFLPRIYSPSIDYTPSLLSWCAVLKINPHQFDKTKYLEDLNSSKILLGYNGELWLGANWFENKIKPGTLKNALVMLVSCYSAENTALVNAFLRKGAVNVIGFKGTVNIGYAHTFMREMYSYFLDGKTIRQAVDLTRKKIGTAGGTALLFQKVHSSSIEGDTHRFNYFSLAPKTIRDSIISNGGFEETPLHNFLKQSMSNFGTYWIPEGDARILPNLAEYSAFEGNQFSLIGTGLGYASDLGNISQTINIKSGKTQLKFSWNLLSEEFAWILPNQYQDHFQVSACKDDGSCEPVFIKKIDDLAASVIPSTAAFGLGDLSKVSATGWQTSYVDLSKYVGQTIMLKFEVKDDGDGYYDTAVMLDAISIQ